jgi:hypothetical protein
MEDWTSVAFGRLAETAFVTGFSVVCFPVVHLHHNRTSDQILAKTISGQQDDIPSNNDVL